MNRLSYLPLPYAITMRKISPLAYIFLLIVLYETEEAIQSPATIRILENAICQRLLTPGDGSAPINESMCKTTAVQQRLAFVRGWYSFWTTIPVVLLGPVFGNLADSVGRRKVFAITIFGMLGSIAWVFFICSFWWAMPTELVWLTALFRCVGGGPFVAIALYMAMVADCCTEDSRGQQIYRAFSFKLAIDLIAPQIASASLQHSLWLPFLICGLSLLLMLPVLLIMPETLPFSEDYLERDQNHILTQENGSMIYKEYLMSKPILLGLATVFLTQFRYNVLQLLLPYISVHFNWAIGKATKLLSIIPAISLVIFIVLPYLTDYFRDHHMVSGVRFNIYLVRLIIACLFLGVALIAAAPNIAILSLGLVIFAAGFGIRAPMLTFMSGHLVTFEDTGKLYTLISTTDALGHLIGSPLFEYIWAWGLELEGSWLALPFFFLIGLFLIASILSWLLPYTSTATIHNGIEGEQEQEPLL